LTQPQASDHSFQLMVGQRRGLLIAGHPSLAHPAPHARPSEFAPSSSIRKSLRAGKIHVRSNLIALQPPSHKILRDPA
jgi:hypothetical protein